MRITYVVPSISRDGGGVSEVVRLLALTFARDPDFEIEVVTLVDEHYKADLPRWEGVNVRAFPFVGPSNYGFSLPMARYLWRSNADVMHVHGIWMFHCLPVLLWSRRRSGRYLVSPHGMLERWILARSAGKKKLISKLYQNKFLRCARVIHVLTAKETEDVEAVCPGSRVEVVPNYVPDSPEKNERLLGAPSWIEPFQGRTVYLFLGRIHEKKGCLELLRAWDEKCGADSEFRDNSVLAFCGWIDGLDNFAAEVRSSYDRHQNVIYAGPQYGDDKTKALQAAHFFLLPSKSEGLPLAILEAWKAGLIVIMTDECNLPLGFERHAALRTQPETAAIVSVLGEAASLPETGKEALRRAGHELMETEFSEKIVREKFVTLYRNL